jgi:hypothetical protein
MPERKRINTPYPPNSFIDQTVGEPEDRINRVEEVVKIVLQPRIPNKRLSDRLKVGQSAALRRYLKNKKGRSIRKAADLL